jgi:type IX secretion system PorP/SprF family membrane protein
MKKLLCISLVIIITFPAFGQDAQYSHHMFSQMSVNPGFAGSSDMVVINALNRNQYMKLGSASPRYSVFSANAPFNLLGMSHGVGIIVNNDKFGVNNDLGFQLAYAYQKKMAIGDGKLGIGVSFGLNSSKFSASELNGGDDPLVPKDEVTNNIFNMGLGVYYKSEKIYMGLSTTNLIHGVRDYKTSEGGDVNPLTRNYYITAGYNYQLPNPMFVLVPSFLIQSDGATTTMNFNTNVIYNNRIWGGLSYRAGTAVTALFGLELLAGIRFGVAYDYETTMFRKAATTGSIEVVVIYSFKLKKEKIPQRYKSIRFL